jgi:hypothetical protein
VGSIPNTAAKSWTTVEYISAIAHINPIINEKTVRPSSKSTAPDWSVTKRAIKLFIAQILLEHTGVKANAEAVGPNGFGQLEKAPCGSFRSKIDRRPSSG